MRLEEVPLLKKQYEEHLVADKEFWEQQERDRVRFSLTCDQALLFLLVRERLERSLIPLQSFADLEEKKSFLTNLQWFSVVWTLFYHYLRLHMVKIFPESGKKNESETESVNFVSGYFGSGILFWCKHMFPDTSTKLLVSRVANSVPDSSKLV